MPLVATIAGTTANSYLTVAAADEIANTVDTGRHPGTWMATPLDAKERALMTATSYIDGWKRWTSTTYAVGQALVFPRLLDVRDSLPYLHPNVRRACYEQAVYLLANGDVLDDAATRHARGMQSFQDDDGSGSLPNNRTKNLIAPEAEMFLRAVSGIRVVARTLISVPVRSATYP